MSEKGRIVLISFLFLILIGLSFKFMLNYELGSSFKAKIESYSANVEEISKGNFNVYEEANYRVNKDYLRMVYRYFESEINKDVFINSIYCSKGIPYIVYTNNGIKYINLLENLPKERAEFVKEDILDSSFPNEVGCYFYNSPEIGEKINFTVKYKTKDFCSLYGCLINLATYHAVFPKFSLKSNIFVEPSNYLAAYMRNAPITISSDILPNLFHVLLVLFHLFSRILFIFALFYPIKIFRDLYLKYGEEKYNIDLPDIISTEPRDRKPWFLNLAFFKDNFTMTFDGFYATLIDLENKGVLKIDIKDDNVVIRIINDKIKLDPYEKLVVDFIKKYSDPVFNFKELEKKARSISFGRKLYKDLERLKYKFDPKKKDNLNLLTKEKMKEILDYTGYLKIEQLFANSIIYSSIIGFILLMILIYLPLNVSLQTPIAYILFSLLVFNIGLSILYFQPPSFFGRYTEQGAREKEMWYGFMNYLDKQAKMGKYEKEDIVMWQKWLIYAVALGVGKKIAKKLKGFEKLVKTLELLEKRTNKIYFIASSTYSTRTSSGGISIGGGFGGGGFGSR